MASRGPRWGCDDVLAIGKHCSKAELRATTTKKEISDLSTLVLGRLQGDPTTLTTRGKLKHDTLGTMLKNMGKEQRSIDNCDLSGSTWTKALFNPDGAAAKLMAAAGEKVPQYFIDMYNANLLRPAGDGVSRATSGEQEEEGREVPSVGAVGGEGEVQENSMPKLGDDDDEDEESEDGRNRGQEEVVEPLSDQEELDSDHYD